MVAVVPSFDRVETARLVLRRWTDADHEPFAAMNADAEVMRYFPAPMSRAESDAFVDRIEAAPRTSMPRPGASWSGSACAETQPTTSTTQLSPTAARSGGTSSTARRDRFSAVPVHVRRPR